MARTVRRQPVTVPIESPKEYYFTHINWKGLCNNKNFLNIDQQTFADCNNVFVDTENILKSRPPVVLDTNYTIDNVINTWTFGDIIAVHNISGIVNGVKMYRLVFIRNYNTIMEISTGEFVQLIPVERKIFIFTDNKIQYFDTVEFGLNDATDYIYIPKTKVSSNSIVTDNEQPNELTTSEWFQYLYNIDNSLDFSLLLNKEVVVNIPIEKNNGKFPIVFILDNERVIVTPYSTVVSSIIDISEVGTMISYYNGVISYSPDGKVFYAVEPIRDIIGKPIINKNGSSIIVFKSDGVWTLSIARTDFNEYKFSTWTKIPYDINGTFNSNIIPTGYFITNDIYAFIVVNTVGTKFLHFANPDVASGKYTYVMDGTTFDTDELGELRFTTVAAVGNTLAVVSKFSGSQEVRKHVIILDISSSGVISKKEDYLLDYDSANLISNTADIGLKLSFNNVDENNIRKCTLNIAGTTIRGDVLWSIDLNNSTIDEVTAKVIHTSTNSKFIISEINNSVLTSTYLYYNDNVIPLLFSATPVSNYYYIFVKDGNQIYTSKPSTIMSTIDVLTKGVINNKVFSHYEELSTFYLSHGSTLYISEIRRNDKDEFLWYLPKVNTQQFTQDITNLHILTKEDLGIFFADEIWYVTPVSINNRLAYTYVKSKLSVGVLQGADVITSYDGKYILFGTDRGLVSMSYQDFIASTEQTLTYLSDNIQSLWNKFVKEPVKLLMHLYYIICYRYDSNMLLVFDIRNGSWWPFTYKQNVTNVLEFNKEIYIVSDGKFHKLGNYDKYADDKNTISWHITSQLLHLSAINNYKHISNITLTTVSDNTEPITLGLKVINYRKLVDIKDTQILEYSVDIVNTFVKRLNFSKVNQFQYKLSSDDSNTKPLPLSLTSIIVKYGVKERVR